MQFLQTAVKPLLQFLLWTALQKVQDYGMAKPRFRLRELRKCRGLTVEGVAAELGVDASTVSRHERNETKLVSEKHQMWADFYGLHPAELFADVRVCPPHLIDILDSLEKLSPADQERIQDFIDRLSQSPAA